MDKLNFVETGGQFGRKRRLPGYTIDRHANGTYLARDDASGKTAAAGYPTLEALVESMRLYSERRC